MRCRAVGFCVWMLIVPEFVTAQKPAALQPQANLSQLMRGILFPNSNVVFSAQSDDPAEVKPAKKPSLATDPLTSTYGKWDAVENSALALVESANLMMMPGRKCANGVDVPVTSPEWAKFVQELRDAGMKSYQAAKAKSQDNILDATDALTTSCGHCHGKWREKANLQDRCK